jgi:cyclopropane-fatty-acyl-phospholipid synthase
MRRVTHPADGLLEEMEMRNANVLGITGSEPVQGGSVVSARPQAPASSSTLFDRALARLALRLANSPAIALVLWDGQQCSPPGKTPVARFHLNNRGALYGMLRNPELHFGDAYSTGQIDVEGDFLGALEAVYRAIHSRQSDRYASMLRWLRSYRQRNNTILRARDNIQHHYDISADFYRLWLDQAAIQYTCAYFPSENMTLEQAQVAKMNHVARKLMLKPGETVVEAGSGWGGLALHLARRFGVKVRSYNISKEQVKFARQRLKQSDVADQVEYIEDDYRNIAGEYDAFVSVGMLEHVGPAHYREMGRVIDRCLKPEGRGLIHSIGRNRLRQMNAWIERRIFPGAHPPTLREMMDIFEPNGLSVLDVENLRLHYSRTLTAWLDRFEANLDSVRSMYDETFVRAWRLYLVGSIAAFNVGALQLFQVVFSRATNNSLPWSRMHLYRDHT